MTVDDLWGVIKAAVSGWVDDYAQSMGAALAYYTMFSIAPLLLIAAVSFWPTSDYELIPGFTGQNYVSLFEGCSNLAEPCVTLKTYNVSIKSAQCCDTTFKPSYSRDTLICST